MKRALLLSAVLLLFAQAAAAAPDVLSWLNGVRGMAAALSSDPVLMETAQAYAELCASVGRISHTGPDGSDALTRYLRMGGTCARVAEIIGAGPGLEEIEAAWMQSVPHRDAVMRTSWTDAGWGSARTASGEVWVVLFARRLVRELVVSHGGGDWTVSGRLLAPDAVRPVIVSGMDRIDAVEWLPDGGGFLFRASESRWSGYVRLGYLTSAGALVITDVLTSPRGTGYR